MLHPLVVAQLRQLGLDPESPPDREAWKHFLEAVSRTQNTPDLTPGGHPVVVPAINYMDETELLISSISIILIGIDTDGRISRWNHIAEATFGILDDEIIGQPFADCAIRWDWERVRLAIAKSLEFYLPSELTGVRYIRPDGKEGFLDLNVSPSSRRGDRGMKYLLLGTDVTERRVREGLTRKLSTIGQLTAGITRELGAAIRAVSADLDLLNRRFAELRQALANPGKETARKVNSLLLAEELPKAFQQAQTGVGQANTLLGALAEFTQADADQVRPVDLNRLVENALTVTRCEYQHVANLVTRLDPALPPVPCRGSEISQVLFTLLINAAHAIGDVVRGGGKGTITVATRRDGAWAELRVSDTGTGIPEAVRPRLFDSFFTTKPLGKGVGQNLLFAHAIVTDRHHGSIAFETETGKGATFVVRLPLPA
jgi:PAS domain S-box-containing protein